MRKEGSAVALARAYRRAIINHCLECSGGCRREVERCRVKSCALWEYRMGATPTAGTLMPSSVSADGAATFPRGKAMPSADSAGGAATFPQGKAFGDDEQDSQLSMMEMLMGG